jgi:hypothetical protein
MAKDRKEGSTTKAGPTPMGKAPFALFAVLLLASVAIVTLANHEAAPKLKSEAMVDAQGILDALLGSTIDQATYTDLEGNATIYTGWTVQSLLVEDLETRNNRTVDPNITSLQNGIEAKVLDLLKALSGNHHYNLKVSFRTSVISITDVSIGQGAKSEGSISMRSFEGKALVNLIITE